MAGGADERPLILVGVQADDARARTIAELERRYGADYRVLGAEDTDRLRGILEETARNGERVALVLSDDASVAVGDDSPAATGDPSPAGAAPGRGGADAGAGAGTGAAAGAGAGMGAAEPDTGGSTIFSLARSLFPDARRGLLIEWGAWARRSTVTAVLRLMSGVQIDYYVVLPTHSPDEYFHRTVTEFLLEWAQAAGSGPQFFTVIGDDAQPRTHELRSLLARGGVPHRYLSPDSEDGKDVLTGAGVAYSGSPLVRLADGRVLAEPTNAQLAEAYGLTTALPDRVVDVAVIGAGPGGLAAAVYAASEGLDTLVLECDSIGGQAGSSSLIRNYLGFARGISGANLAQRAYQQAWVFGATFAHTREVVGMRVEPDGFRFTVAPGDEVVARSAILATGVSYRRLDVPSLTPFVGSAVFYGAASAEAKAQSGRTVHVVGGGNSAGQAALHLARYAGSVSIIVRSATLAESMSRYLIDELEAAGVRIITQAKLVGGGSSGPDAGKLDHIVLRDRVTGEETTLPSDAVFITIGAAPHTDWLAGEVLRDKWGYVLTGSDVLVEGGRRAWPRERQPGALESAAPGFFAVGDVRRGSVKRVASAVGEGSVVVSSVHAYLAEAAALNAG